MAWIALRYRGEEYTARDLIDISKRFLEGSGSTFQNYEIYDDCDMLMICGVDSQGRETCCELSLDDLPRYRQAPGAC